MQEDQIKMVKAKDALELKDSKANKNISSKISISLEELNDLKEVWSEMDMINKQLEVLKEKQWLTIQVKKLIYTPLSKTVSISHGLKVSNKICLAINIIL